MESRIATAESVQIFKTATSDGTTGFQWTDRLMGKGCRVNLYAVRFLISAAFVATTGVVYKLVIIKGDEFKDKERTAPNIRAEGVRRGHLTPPVETGTLLCEALSHEEIEAMGLWRLIVMHEPFVGPDGAPDLLGITRIDGGLTINAYLGDPQEFERGIGFVFLAAPPA